MFIAAQDGFLLSLSLIVAIGAQNLFVMRQGLRNEHVLGVVLTCALIDTLLIFAGVAGFGTIIAQIPWATTLAAWCGALYLFVYGAMALKQVIWPKLEEVHINGAGQIRSLKAALIATAAFSLLNPSVYLDTVVLLGSIGAQYPFEQRFIFAGGASVASFIWFFAVGFGAKKAAPLLTKPAAQRWLDAFVWIVMWSIAVNLVWSQFT